eukprot:1043727-Prorocentrum_lima.AAC.1
MQLEAVQGDVPIELSSKYYNKGDLRDGVYAEIHKLKYQYMIAALRTDGFVVTPLRASTRSI